MFQTFEVRGDRNAAFRNLPRLRAAMRRLDVDALLLPHDDEYLNEYTPPQHDRLCWATGFSGSAGALLLMEESAVLFVDGRYTEQARLETPADSFEYEDLRAMPPADWLLQNPGRVRRLAYAAMLHTRAEIAKVEAIDGPASVDLIPLDEHPVDALWEDRPTFSAEAPFLHELTYAGESSADKRQRVAAVLQQAGTDCAVLTNPNSSAWLLNMRGADVPNTPVALCRSVIHSTGETTVFFSGHDVSPELASHLGDEVTVADAKDYSAYLRELGKRGCRVLLDPSACPDAVYRTLRDSGAVIRNGSDPVVRLRAVKNSVEIDGARDAHVRDGVAVVRFLRWLDEQRCSGVSEIDAVVQLESIRLQDSTIRGPSFDTIAGSGPNGAIIHYRVSEASNRVLEDGELFLVDSGGQYPGGTTDITRTIALGPQDAERRDRYTRVLKGHIALATAVFPPDTAGRQLDVLARQPLWDAGVDYAHGTGHGVGTFLGVHEGPQSIAKRAAHVPFEVGMSITIEPGFYREGHYGIRIENVAVVRESQRLQGMLEFETLTLAPIDTTPIEIDLMTDAELDWLNAYHRRVRDVLLPLLDNTDAEWLVAATAALDRSGAQD